MVNVCRYLNRAIREVDLRFEPGVVGQLNGLVMLAWSGYSPLRLLQAFGVVVVYKVILHVILQTRNSD